MQEAIEVAPSTIVKENTYHLLDVKIAILHLVGNPSGITETAATVGPVTTTSHIKVPGRHQLVKTVAHLYSNRNSDAMITQRLRRQCHLMAARHHSNTRRYCHLMRGHRPRPPIQFANNTVRLDTATIMMITDGVVEEEPATEVVTEEIIMAVRPLSFTSGTNLGKLGFILLFVP